MNRIFWFLFKNEPLSSGLFPHPIPLKIDAESCGLTPSLQDVFVACGMVVCGHVCEPNFFSTVLRVRQQGCRPSF
jgi:hypothetical protein